MLSDDDLVRDVKDELAWDRTLDPDAIAVSADAGRVTLRGSIGSLHKRRAATRAAERVFGVVSVDNRLEIQPMSARRREDADLRADVLQALMLDSLVPRTIDVKVDEGLVTLTGTAEWQYERDAADLAASSVAGVVDVADEIEVRQLGRGPS